MAAAPSLEALFDTQAIFESAMSAYISANGLACFTSRGPEDLPDARIVAVYIPGESIGHQATSSTSKTGWPELDMFGGEFRFQVQTERAKAAASPVDGFVSVQDYWVARLKVLMLRGALNGTRGGITAMVLPYHSIFVEAFAGQTPTIEDDAFDVTELSYRVQSQILPDAWPAQPAP